MKLMSSTIIKRTRLKALISEKHGPGRLESGLLEESHKAHDNWKHIVERYSLLLVSLRRKTN
jgi:hypothetical protein